MRSTTDLSLGWKALTVYSTSAHYRLLEVLSLSLGLVLNTKGQPLG